MVFWLGGFYGRSLSSTKEQPRGRSFKDFIGKGGGVKLASKLRKLAESFGIQAPVIGRRLQWRDHHSTILLEVMQMV